MVPYNRAWHQQLACEKVHSHFTALPGAIVDSLFRSDGRVTGGALGLDVAGDERRYTRLQHVVPELVRDQERLVKS
jgi:predicted cupin superfamily sugar epimerase